MRISRNCRSKSAEGNSNSAAKELHDASFGWVKLSNVRWIEFRYTVDAKQQMGQLMKKTKDLSCLGGAIVQVDDRKLGIDETEARYLSFLKGVLENENADFLYCVPPCFQCGFTVSPALLLLQCDSEVLPNGLCGSRDVAL